MPLSKLLAGASQIQIVLLSENVAPFTSNGFSSNCFSSSRHGRIKSSKDGGDHFPAQHETTKMRESTASLMRHKMGQKPSRLLFQSGNRHSVCAASVKLSVCVLHLFYLTLFNFVSASSHFYLVSTMSSDLLLNDKRMRKQNQD